MKTPEQMAEEFSKFEATYGVGSELLSYRQGLFEGYLTGYQAAKDEILSKGMQGYITEIRNDAWCTAMQLGQQSQWISVKERLPEDGDDLSIMLVWRNIEHDYDTVRWRYQQGWDCVIQDKSTITHWQPLPKPPEEK